MTTALAHPTTHDEEWRYADGDWLGKADPVELGHWHEHEVAPGEIERGVAVFEPGLGSKVDRLRVHVGAHGRYEHFVINAGGPYARCELDVVLDEGAHFELGGVILGGGDARAEIVTRVVHAPASSSSQVVRAVQWGKSTGNFLGKIEIPRHSQQVDAAQNFKAILLEAGARPMPSPSSKSTPTT